VIVRSTIELAHSLGPTVVAEGVEDETTKEILIRYGCDRAQDISSLAHVRPTTSWHG